MLYLEIGNTPTRKTKAVIKDNSEAELLKIRETIMQNLKLENPAKTFAKKMKSGMFNQMPECEVADIAEYTNIISDAWRKNMEDENSGQPYMELHRVLINLMQLYVDEKMQDNYRFENRMEVRDEQ